MNPFPGILSGCNSKVHCSNPREGGVKKGFGRVVEGQSHAKTATCSCSHGDLFFDKSAMLEFLMNIFCLLYRVFSHDVTAAMLVSQNKEMAAMLVSQTKPLGIELYFYANTFFCFSKPIWPVVM